MNRFDIFEKNFKWVYRNFNGSYDINQDPDLFASTLKAYYDASKSIPSDKIYEFCQYIAHFEKWPLMAQWYDVARSYAKDPEIETPQKQKSKKEQLEGQLKMDIVAGFWPLFSTLEGRVMVARIYAYTCFKNHLELPNYWKQHLVYAPLIKLEADYFDRKPFTKNELKLMGAKIDQNNRDKNGRPVMIGKKVGSIVSGFFISNNTRKRKY